MIIGSRTRFHLGPFVVGCRCIEFASAAVAAAAAIDVVCDYPSSSSWPLLNISIKQVSVSSPSQPSLILAGYIMAYYLLLLYFFLSSFFSYCVLEAGCTASWCNRRRIRRFNSYLIDTCNTFEFLGTRAARRCLPYTLAFWIRHNFCFSSFYFWSVLR